MSSATGFDIVVRYAIVASTVAAFKGKRTWPTV
ncbi:hypothetical protein BKP42_61630 [Rhodococcus erythropolis]|nr:hypothetical protein BKP42_61630 [Rhodococcus erythropolis]